MNQQTHATKILVEALNTSRPSNDLPNPHAPPAYTIHPTVEATDIAPAALDVLESDSSTTCEEFSSINFTIRTPLHIVGNGNLVALSPPVLAASIAEKIMKELKGASMTDGIPMIDEHGRPRPIEVVVDAGMDVRGNGNVVGEREVLGVVARNIRRSSPVGGVANLAANAVSATVTAEPRTIKRAASEPLSEPVAKRERMS